jgi:hypothetical protein
MKFSGTLSENAFCGCQKDKAGLCAGRIMFARNSRLSIEGHADVSGLQVRDQKSGPVDLPEGLRPRSTTAESKGLEGSNPVRSCSQSSDFEPSGPFDRA